MRQVPPFDALADQGQFGGTFDHHHVLDEGSHPHWLLAGHLSEGWPAVAQDPGIAVVVAAYRSR